MPPRAARGLAVAHFKMKFEISARKSTNRTMLRGTVVIVASSPSMRMPVAAAAHDHGSNTACHVAGEMPRVFHVMSIIRGFSTLGTLGRSQITFP